MLYKNKRKNYLLSFFTLFVLWSFTSLNSGYAESDHKISNRNPNTKTEQTTQKRLSSNKKLAISQVPQLDLRLDTPQNDGLQGPSALSSFEKQVDLDILQARVSKTLTARHYILGPNDDISVSFLGAPELNMDLIRISPEGTIMLAGLPPVQAAGLSLTELQEQIEKGMSKYLVNETTAVNLIHSRPFSIQVSGAVISPGTYEINTTPSAQGGSTVIQGTKSDRVTPLLSNVLLTAGGVSYNADLSSVHIDNDITGDTFTVNLFDLLDGKRDGDIYLAYGDRIHVDKLPSAFSVSPEEFQRFDSATFSPSSFPVKVYGYVRNPGVIEIDPRQSNNLASAIMQAGGYNADFGYSPEAIFLSRVDGNGNLATTRIDPKQYETVLMPNDTIYVPEKNLPKVVRGANILTAIMSPIFRAAATYNTWALLFNPTRNFIE
ncbi:MAG: polysaccharide biosynthesis/export family protein [Cyanobacteria bacterium P01_H01_bin.74]